MVLVFELCMYQINSISFLFVLLKGMFYLFANSFSTGHFVATDRNTVDEIPAQKGYVLMQ